LTMPTHNDFPPATANKRSLFPFYLHYLLFTQPIAAFLRFVFVEFLAENAQDVNSPNPTTAQWTPKVFHSSSTRFFVASSIRISYGQGLVNPSVAHFLVA